MFIRSGMINGATLHVVIISLNNFILAWSNRSLVFHFLSRCDYKCLVRTRSNNLLHACMDISSYLSCHANLSFRRIPERKIGSLEWNLLSLPFDDGETILWTCGVSSLILHEPFLPLAVFFFAAGFLPDDSSDTMSASTSRPSSLRRCADSPPAPDGFFFAFFGAKPLPSQSELIRSQLLFDKASTA